MANIINNTDFGVNVKGELTLSDIESGVPLYHRPMDSRDSDAMAIIKSLMTYGFSREYTGANGGNMYGPGVYNVYSLRSSNEKARGYGKYIVRSYLLGGYKNFLVFNSDMAKQVYGDKWRINDQIRMLMPSRMAEDIISRFKPYMNDNSTTDSIKTSVIAVRITDYLGSRISQTKIRGIVYSGNHDGDCAFVRNFSDVVPHSYSKDNGRTWITAITDELIWRAGHNTDVDATLRNASNEQGKKHFDDTADRSINGYVIVYKGKKANYFEVAENKLISDIWFDFASNFDENGEASVIYHNNKLTIGKYEDGEYVVYDEDGAPLCYLKDLPSTLGMNEDKEYISNLVEQCIFESRRLIDNFDTAAKVMEFGSDDDFYFVQIIKRFKDNPNDDKRQGNYHGGAWYPYKGFRIKSVDELMSLKPKIIDLCNQSNARAYMTVNSRSDKATDNQIVKVRGIYPPSDARNQYADEIVPAQAKHGRNWQGQRLKFFIDIDTKDKRIWAEVKKILQLCNMDSIGEYETPNGGLHIIMPNKEHPNIEYMQHMLHKIDGWRNKGRLATAHPNFDGKIILYSNVDALGY